MVAILAIGSMNVSAAEVDGTTWSSPTGAGTGYVQEGGAYTFHCDAILTLDGGGGKLVTTLVRVDDNLGFGNPGGIGDQDTYSVSYTSTGAGIDLKILAEITIPVTCTITGDSLHGDGQYEGAVSDMNYVTMDLTRTGGGGGGGGGGGSASLGSVPALAATALPLAGAAAAIGVSLVPPPSPYVPGPGSRPTPDPTTGYQRRGEHWHEDGGRGPIQTQVTNMPPTTSTPTPVGQFAVQAGWPEGGGLPQGGVGVTQPQLYDQYGKPLSPRDSGGQAPVCPTHGIPYQVQYPLKINGDPGSWFCPLCAQAGMGGTPPGYRWGFYR